jgi:hypothetical protein
MTDSLQLEESEDERLKQGLFIDVIRLSPEEAELVITTDSWSDLPLVFGEFMNVKKGEWIIKLIPPARELLVKQALSDNIQTKLVHFYIVEDGVEIVKSYDAMCSIVVEPSFPYCERLKKEYAALEVM